MVGRAERMVELAPTHNCSNHPIAKYELAHTLIEIEWYSCTSAAFHTLPEPFWPVAP